MSRSRIFLLGTGVGVVAATLTISYLTLRWFEQLLQSNRRK